MQRCWQQQRLSLSTKLRLYQTCVLEILLHGADTLTLLADDIRRLQSFHMGCQRQLLGVKWQDHVKNTDIADMTSLPNIGDIITKRRQWRSEGGEGGAGRTGRHLPGAANGRNLKEKLRENSD